MQEFYISTYDPAPQNLMGGGGGLNQNMGDLKLLSKHSCEGVHLIVKLPAMSLQASKFTKNELLHTYFSRILAKLLFIVLFLGIISWKAVSCFDGGGGGGCFSDGRGASVLVGGGGRGFEKNRKMGRGPPCLLPPSPTMGNPDCPRNKYLTHF